MCKCSHLIIGETVTLDWNTVECSSCLFVSGPGVTYNAVYDGHKEIDNSVFHIFIVRDVYCQYCRSKFDWVRDPCDSPPSYWIENIEEIDLEIA